jgi:HAE1 family hydrophobic/amphiphilic exporter-1
MNISEIFIRRPVATVLLALGVIMAGAFAYRLLPVSALPQVDYPTISVSAQMAGASPETMATTVATPLIKELETISGIDTLIATSTLGNTQITIQFDLNTNLDSAATDVQTALSSVTRRLPANMTAPPTYRKVNPANAPVILIALQSATMSLTELDALAQNVITPSLATINGVAQAQVNGSKTYAVRVEVDPSKLAARNLSMDQVASALAHANSQTPLGTYQNSAQSLTIDASTQLTSAELFRKLVIAKPNDNPVHLDEVANVIDSVANTQTASFYDGKPALILSVDRQAGANTVNVVDAIKAKLPALQAGLPKAVDIHIMNDNSVSIRGAVHDVQFNLLLTLSLVILVIYLFLGRAYATLIPALAIPLSLIATFGGMYLLGFSVDNLSLLGLTLTVGLVVDDAIVMLENIMRHVEQGEKPLEAALVGSREVGGTIVSMSLSLMAVFIPILLMGGVLGRLFNEFGMVVSMAIAASALVSLTVTPMLAARLPRRTASPSRFSPIGLFERIFHRTLAGYGRGVKWCLSHPLVVMLTFAGTVAASGWLYTSIPASFFPQEDIGQLSISTQARQDISYAAMSDLQHQAAAVVQASPAVDHVASILGQGSLNGGSMFVQLKPKNQRAPLAQVLADLRKALGRVPGIKSFIVPAQSLRIGGRQSQSQYQFVVQSIDPQQLSIWSAKLADAMRQDPQHFIDVATDAQNTALEANVAVNHDRADALGISADAIRSAIQAGFGSQIVASIETAGTSSNVVLEYDPTLPWTDQLLSTITVRSDSGMLVPLSTVASVVRMAGPVTVNQTGQLTSVTLSFNLPNGTALGEATKRIDQIKNQIGLPTNVFTAYSGTAQVFAQSLANQGLLIMAAILTIYIVLGVLYESFIHPITILSGLPAAALGALLALKLTGLDLSVIAIIGILMLIGIVKKNAIMMVDVAIELQRRQGFSASAAIYEAAVRRFRPIMMTTFCALFGALPIALGTGASAELRQPLGIAVVGGLLLSQLLTLFITPVFFIQMDRLSHLPTTIRLSIEKATKPTAPPLPAE